MRPRILPVVLLLSTIVEAGMVDARAVTQPEVQVRGQVEGSAETGHYYRRDFFSSVEKLLGPTSKLKQPSSASPAADPESNSPSSSSTGFLDSYFSKENISGLIGKFLGRKKKSSNRLTPSPDKSTPVSDSLSPVSREPVSISKLVDDKLLQTHAPVPTIFSDLATTQQPVAPKLNDSEAGEIVKRARQKNCKDRAGYETENISPDITGKGPYTQACYH
ncbi:hypothetical protein B0O99DRAFT_688173 [Bisporella sp. PMI_857]|nr:hypothetical protein B0O99DRAFT_688173 [Bisporella sp. PMI_857]